MSAVLTTAPFGDPESVRRAEIGNAAFSRALNLGYGRMTAQQFARVAKRDALDSETPAAVALRVVPPRQASATRPNGPGPRTAA